MVLLFFHNTENICNICYIKNKLRVFHNWGLCISEKALLCFIHKPSLSLLWSMVCLEFAYNLQEGGLYKTFINLPNKRDVQKPASVTITINLLFSPINKIKPIQEFFSLILCKILLQPSGVPKRVFSTHFFMPYSDPPDNCQPFSPIWL